MKDKKCTIGETNFISPPRPCAPNLWKDAKKSYEKYMVEMNKKGYSPSWGLNANLNWN